ncbi:hypothetical protein BD410DRAFT_847150 [Rickenella mellea]|uniref:Uncharacterized protein n=1 Tax=Rickenella mellea TaxID=50990 RepID=A0A4Y7PDY1_9AGAM|nr:hypothetical protein BD410DRAFT_847150 [Rickenella mellea]
MDGDAPIKPTLECAHLARERLCHSLFDIAQTGYTHWSTCSSQYHSVPDGNAVVMAFKQGIREHQPFQDAMSALIRTTTVCPTCTGRPARPKILIPPRRIVEDSEDVEVDRLDIPKELTREEKWKTAEMYPQPDDEGGDENNGHDDHGANAVEILETPNDDQEVDNMQEATEDNESDNGEVSNNAKELDNGQETDSSDGLRHDVHITKRGRLLPRVRRSSFKLPIPNVPFRTIRTRPDFDDYMHGPTHEQILEDHPLPSPLENLPLHHSDPILLKWIQASGCFQSPHNLSWLIQNAAQSPKASPLPPMAPLLV